MCWLAGAVSTETVVVQEGKRAVKFRPCIDIHKVYHFTWKVFLLNYIACCFVEVVLVL